MTAAPSNLSFQPKLHIALRGVFYLLAAILLAYSWLPTIIGVPNERSRVYLAMALVDDGSVSIDGPVERFGPIYDWAEFEGRFYTDKAPGSSIPAAGIYWLFKHIAPDMVSNPDELIVVVRRFLMIPVGLLSMAFLRWMLRALGVREPTIDIVSIGWIVGSTSFHYSAAFYGHQLVALALIAALFFVYRGMQLLDEDDATRAWAFMILGGMCAGYAGLTEYQAGLPCLMLAVYCTAISFKKRSTVFLGFAIGAIPFVAALLLYNDHCFGGPLELSYHHLIIPELQERHHHGIGGITYPHLEYAAGGLLSPHRGLFVTAPMFLFLPLGVIILWTESKRALSILIGASLLYGIWFISSTDLWMAGWSFGPRLLVPMMGWWCVGIAVAIDAIEELGAGPMLTRPLIAIGIVNFQLVRFFMPEPLHDSWNVPFDIIQPLAEQGLPAANILSDAGASTNVVIAVWGCLVLMFIGIVTTRGLIRTKPWVQFMTTIVTIAAVAIFLALVYYAAPRWSPEQQAEFLNWYVPVAEANLQ